jgi:hypothetical protein
MRFTGLSRGLRSHASRGFPLDLTKLAPSVPPRCGALIWAGLHELRWATARVAMPNMLGYRKVPTTIRYVPKTIRDVFSELYASSTDERDKGDKFERLMAAYCIWCSDTKVGKRTDSEDISPYGFPTRLTEPRPVGVGGRCNCGWRCADTGR